MGYCYGPLDIRHEFFTFVAQTVTSFQFSNDTPSHQMKRLSRWALLSLATLVLTACSLLGLLYQQIPTLTYWRIDDMLDLRSDQTTLVRSEIDQLFVWHKQSQLPEVANTLKRWQQWSRGNLQSQQVCAEFDRFREMTTDLLDASHAAWGRLIPTLSSSQIEHLAQYYEQEDVKFVEESLGAAQHERRVRRYTRWTDRLYGDLTPKQSEWLSNTLKQSSYKPEQFLRERQAYQQDVINTLKRLRSTSTELAQQGIQELQQRHWSRAPSADAQAQIRRQEFCDLVAGLHNQTTPEQRAQAAANLASWERELRKLARP